MYETSKKLQKELLGLGNQIRAKAVEDGKYILIRDILQQMLMFEHNQITKDKWEDLKEYLNSLKSKYEHADGGLTK